MQLISSVRREREKSASRETMVEYDESLCRRVKASPMEQNDRSVRVLTEREASISSRRALRTDSVLNLVMASCT